MTDWADRKARELVQSLGPLHEAALASALRMARRAALEQVERVLEDSMLSTAARYVSEIER